ncbi:hypothetical protein GCM10027037_26840 [Mucilaginibacter koreensis]
MITVFKYSRKIAILLLFTFGVNLITPLASYALTSGPDQPEVKGFQPAGVSDMVDLQTGSFKYNIPLLDIDGYPINLNYQSGGGIDDEASWVGLGWSLNPGAINRQVRGIADDMSGDDDAISTYDHVKDKITVGGRIVAKLEVKGTEKIPKDIRPSGSLSFGVFSDNYTGIGAELGVNAGISYSFANSSNLTGSLGFGINSNTQTGVDASPYLSLSISKGVADKTTGQAGITGSFGYNSRSGLKSRTLGASYGTYAAKEGKKAGEKTEGSWSETFSSSSISYNTEPVYPTVQVPYKSSYESFSFNAGAAFTIFYGGLGGTGYRNTRVIASKMNKKPAYGFLYAERGKNKPDAMMDFVREKDNPIIPSIPNIALPVHLPDLWSYTNQTGSGQFRLYRGGSGVFFDNQTKDESDVKTLGLDVGLGNLFHGGVEYYDLDGTTKTGKWKNDNDYLNKGDFQDLDKENPNNQHVYFKMIGERGVADNNLYDKLSQKSPVLLNITPDRANASYRSKGNINGAPLAVGNLKQSQRISGKTAISYLTAGEAARGAGLDKYINNYKDYPVQSFQVPANNKPQLKEEPVSRDVGDAKTRHISELTVTDEAGKRMVYGIPVYNHKHEEYSFALGPLASYPDNGIINTIPAEALSSQPKGNGNSIDEYYHKESRAPYATSYLLTAILSPDYVDKTGDGITDDDLGTAIKFNYSKVDGSFGWRSPYSGATIQKGLAADPDDDKGSVVYGTKDLWYLSSIETKTKIVYFITEDRNDALGVQDWLGTPDLNVRQKRLREIRLYSKADVTRPIKVVKLEYAADNDALCKGVPNVAVQGSGKLTLKRLWFQYGNSDKGKRNFYEFNYITSSSKYNDVQYGQMVTDRWGNYKLKTENQNGLDNEVFPYTSQSADQIPSSALWQLNNIKLPTGGEINVNYESGDYAYVQNKRASVMTPILGLIPRNASDPINRLNKSIGVQVAVAETPSNGTDPAVATSWFKNKYLNGTDYLYTKMRVKVTSEGDARYWYDYVPCYAKVKQVTVANNVASVVFQDMYDIDGGINPVAISAWQRFKTEYPRYAYPGFRNRVKDNGSKISGAVSAIINAAKNLQELTGNFYKRANSKSVATEVDIAGSFVKMAVSGSKKLGGAVRVKQISIDDKWNNMVNLNTASNPGLPAKYGQVYNYTTIENNKTISSGVASYEPAIGGDENSMHDPVPYTEKIKGGITNYFNLEQPFGESFFPAPSVTYSKVTVTNLGANQQPTLNSGYDVNEFYTTKDFPVKVTVSEIDPDYYKPENFISLMSTSVIEKLSLSQGYTIELNDMDGKAKAVSSYDKGGAKLSSTEYYYKSVDNGGSMSLDNTADVVDINGVKSTATIGRDVEYFTDFREQESNNNGKAINLGTDIFLLTFFGIGIPHFPIHVNSEYKMFRSASSVKIIQSYGIISRVVKMQNGSSVATENIAFDKLTGEPLVTKTQNEFKQSIYSVTMPAYWKYAAMGDAGRNGGIVLKDLTTNANGEITNVSTYLDFLTAGDELISAEGTNAEHYWVINNATPGGTALTKKLIKRDGTLATTTALSLAKVVRSGYRNMLSAGTSTMVCMNNPLARIGSPNQLFSADDISDLKVINASATTYDDQWGAKVNMVVNNDATLVENTSYNFAIAKASVPSPPVYPAEIYDPANPNNNGYTVVNSSLWGGQQNITGRTKDVAIWPAAFTPQNTNTIWGGGIYMLVNFPVSKTYYFATSTTSQSDYGGLLYIDCNQYSLGVSGANVWFMEGHYVTAGQHLIGLNIPNVATSNNGFGVPYAALEIYNNTRDELLNMDNAGAGLNVLFSTRSLQNRNDLNSFLLVGGGGNSNYNVSGGNSNYYYVVGGLVDHYMWSNGQSYKDRYCNVNNTYTLSQIVNPYITGFYGNWRAYQTKVFQQSRKTNNATQKGLDIRNSGFINQFYSYWYFDSSLTNGLSAGWSVKGTNVERWTTANTVTLYDKYGQQLENVDALGRYSAALFDFNGELPAAVASNAMNREIYANSLEDNYYTTNNTDNLPEFTQISTSKTIKQLAVNTVSHSGNYSVGLPTEGVVLNTIVHTQKHKTGDYLILDNKSQYTTQNIKGLYPHGFEPIAAGTDSYLFNAWVKDGNPNDRTVNVQLLKNGTAVTLKCKAVVEGWKLVEGSFNMNDLSAGSSLALTLKPIGSGVYIDDIRIHPFASHLKSYAYDDKTMRLMAELDENAFATFYEYDDEGLLVRVKKETEKGIATIKESRSSYFRKAQ